MNECRNIERLIHLHREGERTPGEEGSVKEHVAGCRACAELLRSVERAGAAVTAARGAAERLPTAPGVVGRTLNEIRRAGATGSGVFPANRTGLKPAIAFALLCVVVLMGQQGRDAWDSIKMERRLAGVAESGRAERLTVSDGLAELARLLTSRSRGARPEGMYRASAVPRFLIPGFGGDDLFRAYADKYPALASVDPYDGIDEGERGVLATEGKAFLEEFRIVVQQGERR